MPIAAGLAAGAAAIGAIVALAPDDPAGGSLPPDETVRDLFGINEAVAIPARIVGTLDAAEQRARIDDRIDKVRALGVRHVRVHSAAWPFLSYDRRPDPTEIDRLLLPILAAGLEPVVMIGPLPGNAPAAKAPRYAPADLDGYAAWVASVVERYDGDGADDAPGLVGRVRTWEADNEPDLHATTPPKGSPRQAPVDFGPPDEYARVARATAAAVHAADPTATVLPAGLWSPAGPRTRAYAEALWGDREFAAEFRATNVHAYPRDPAAAWAGEDAIERLVPGAERWITEVSVGDAQGERAQAVFLAELYLEALRRGIRRVYWHALVEPPAVDRPGPHPTLGHHLYAADGRPKLAAQVMARMIALWGDVPRSEVVPLPDCAGVAIGDAIVVWGACDRPVPAGAREVVVEGLVPAEPDGASVGGTGPEWPIRRIPVQDGVARIDAVDGPVRVLAEAAR